jgi:dipeptidyl aminopeptidase/acylaminoacyl peptidase
MLKVLQPIDRVAIALILLLSLVIGLLVGGSQVCGTNCFFHSGPRVSDFTWQNRQIGAEDTAFILTFDRPMNEASVEQNLSIDPSLPGKISWAGNKIAYTLTAPAPYGTNYELELEGAKEQIGQQQGQTIEPFIGRFSSRDRAFAYIGVQGEERGRLIFYNWTKDKKKILTPAALVVMDFEFYPKGEKILFSAARNENEGQGLPDNQLYSVTTELSSNTSNKVNLIVDSKDYYNLQFDLSQNGEIIVVQRVSKKDPGDFGLWMIRDSKRPQPLNNPPGGDFLIAPDSKTLAMAQGEGIALMPLEPDAQPIDFLPKFGTIVNFSRDGRSAVMVNFNTDNPKLRYIKSLYLVNNQGLQKKLLDTDGSILDCQFDPNATTLYCLLTKLLEGEEYQEQPYLASIDLKTNKLTPILAFPKYQNITMSLASDGLGVLFDQVVAAGTSTKEDDFLRTDSGEAIARSNLWLTIPPSVTPSESSKADLEKLPLLGFHPQWSP